MVSTEKPEAELKANPKTLPLHIGPLKTATVSAQLAALQSLTLEELRGKWTTLYGTAPPKYTRKFFIKRLSYRIQELTYGGLSQATRERMNRLMGEYGLDELGRRISQSGSSGAGKKRKKADLLQGTRLIREYLGVRHEVTVVQGGFEYKGRVYRSLSVIARQITGTQWNGPRFFGMRGKAAGGNT